MKLDTDRARAALGKFLAGLRANRLWPLAIVLLVAIVAVPIALSKSSSSAPVAAPPQGARVPPGTSALPALSVQSTHSRSRLAGHSRDPFAQQGSGPLAATATGATAGLGASSTTSGSTATGASGSSTTPTLSVSATASAPPTSTTVAPPPITPPSSKPTPAPAGLTATQSYGVTLAITNASGGLDTIDSLKRLSVLPSVGQPLLVELGVLKGGHRVLFSVQPGTIVNGPGTCTPGPIDCEILSLGQDQTEGLSVGTANGPAAVALFAVTGIAADQHATPAAADNARRQESAAGRKLLDSSTAGALSLFRYEPSVGAVVDLRNLSVGGS